MKKPNKLYLVTSMEEPIAIYEDLESAELERKDYESEYAYIVEMVKSPSRVYKKKKR